jgi:hypothetical protein
MSGSAPERIIVGVLPMLTNAGCTGIILREQRLGNA